MKTRFILLILLLITTPFIYSQKIGVDSKGKSIFSFYTLSDFRVEFAVDEPFSIGTSFLRFKSTFKNGDITTVVKDKGIYISASMLNSTDFILLKNIKDINPGFSLKLGYQKSIETFNNIDLTPRGTYACGFNGIFSMDNIQLYNETSNTIDRKLPISYGVEGNFTYFSNKKLRNMIALNFSYTKTWNDDELLNFKKVNDAVVTPNIVAFEEFDGRYGILNTKIDKFRVSGSSPFYWGYFNPIPYAVLVSTSNSTPKYFVGTFVNFLNKPLEKKDYSIPASFGVGIDWTYNSEQKWSSANIFIRGSINFGKMK